MAAIREGCLLSPSRWNRFVMGVAEMFLGNQTAGQAALAEFMRGPSRTWRSYAQLWMVCLDLEGGDIDAALKNSQSAFESLASISAAFNLAVTSVLSGRADLFQVADEALDGASINATSKAVVAAATAKLGPHHREVREKLSQRPEPVSAVGRGIINAVWN